MAELEGDALVLNKRGHFKAFTVFICFFMSLGTCSYGTSASVISTTLGQPSFYAYMKLNTNPNEAGILGAMNSLYYAGGFFGALCHGWVADAYGRKMSIFVGGMFVLVSQALIAGAYNPAMFIVFRFFAGWG